MKQSGKEAVLLQEKKEGGQEAPQAMSKIGTILSSLSNEDALKIFVEAGQGIESSTEAIMKLDLTQKRYYVSLKRLIETGLVEKRGNAYVQTMLGKFCFKLCESLLNAMNQRDQLALADKLMKASTLSVKEKEDILNAISRKELIGTARLVDAVHGVRMITDYASFVEETVKMLENAKENVYLAANKIDMRVADAMLTAIDRGANLFILSVEASFSESMNVLKMILNPSSVKMIQRWFSTNELNVRLTEKMSYGFIVVDGEYGVIELTQPAQNDFSVAFKFKNASFCQKLISEFVAIYESAKEDPRIGLVRKYLSSYK